MKTFGAYVRKIREEKKAKSLDFSLRKVAETIGVEPSYLSKIERDGENPSEGLVCALAEALGEDPNVLLAMAGKVSKQLQAIIVKRPKLFAELLEELDKMPDDAILRVVREVRDGEW